jgi:hypothetical protein
MFQGWAWGARRQSKTELHLLLSDVELQLIATEAEKTSLQQALTLSNMTVRRLHDQHSLVCEERDDLLYMLRQAADRSHDLEAQVQTSLL